MRHHRRRATGRKPAENYVEKTPFLELAGSYTSAIKAMEEITNGLQPDLLFLDIQMPEVNGLEFSRIIGDRCRTISLRHSNNMP